jgi:hypothetical protein
MTQNWESNRGYPIISVNLDNSFETTSKVEFKQTKFMKEDKIELFKE